MADAQLQKAYDLFDEALSHPPEEREAFVGKACGGDDHLSEEVLTLLRHDASTTDDLLPELESGRESTHLDEEHDPFVGRQVGRYHIIRRIGSGAMGAVFEAEQDRPSRHVALKLIHPGLVSPALMRRFDYEVELLGHLQHPGIAQIFEAGQFDVGSGAQPYFAMELIDGEPLTVYANRQDFDVRQRLQLVVEICDAVAHAHQRGIIHRDLKPGNILVDSQGCPKVLDFGVARATSSEIVKTTLHTSTGQLVGTIPYMSPEQAAGQASEVDVRSDVFSIGAILYELLAGYPPHDAARKPFDEAIRLIREAEPTPLRSFNRELRGDIETIVSTALAKEKSRRYQTASALGSDLRRYLDGLPILAHAPSAMYQLRKLAGRHRATVAVAAALVLVLIAASAVSTTFAVSEARARSSEAEARQQAEQEAAIAQEANAFLEDMFKAANPWSMNPIAGVARDVKVVEVLDHAATQLSDRFNDQPGVKLAVRTTLGRTYMSLGEYPKAERQLEDALRLGRSDFTSSRARSLKARLAMVHLLTVTGRFEEGEELCRETLVVCQNRLGDDHAMTLDAQDKLAVLEYSQGRYDTAESLYRRTVAARERTLGEDHPATLVSSGNLAVLLTDLGRFDEAEPLFTRILSIQRDSLGNAHPDTLTTIVNLVNLYWLSGRSDEAEPLIREECELSRRVLGDEHPHTLTSINDLALLLTEAGQYEKANALREEQLAACERTLGPDHPDTLIAKHNLAYLRMLQKRYSEAADLLAETLDQRRRVLGENHLDTLVTLGNLASVLLKQERYEEAEPLYRETLRRRRETFGPDHPDTLLALYNITTFFLATQNLGEAEASAIEYYETASRALGPDHAETLDAMRLLVAVYERSGQDEKAAEWRSRLDRTTSPQPEH
jgi:serine/threonine protein kinase/tetratricopeptide (TPR) repeat protein